MRSANWSSGGTHRDADGEPLALHNLARAWQGLNEHETTIELCREAVQLGRTTNEPDLAVAAPLDTLAISLHCMGDITSAIACWEEAAAVFDDGDLPQYANDVRERARRAVEEV